MNKAKLGIDTPFVGYKMRWGCSVSNIIEFSGGKIKQDGGGELIFFGSLGEFKVIQNGDYILKNTVTNEIILIEANKQ
ncbi:hypothetical protein [Salinicoccus halodurans]|uniref:Uncharacterized protein n=1 Tax=Salinicoccus halodurans TaxID=407035 RepID=A0A0F7HMM9_9STAP|nr:hypothetical protein [Salinicoccus halodurans]AKG74392.1 hypothetical protein AAT16_09195 [Salinicoccus halodurans]SFK95358.1 hypothetical protein SAMN05216235_2737 [Salinicoccus halodurans]